MKTSTTTLFAITITTSLLAGCASTGATPSNSAESSAPTVKVSPTTQAPAKKPAGGGGGEPECD